MPPRRLQDGYLLEVPVLLMVVGMIVAALFPNLPPPGQKVLVSGAVLPVLYSLHYMIVTPGWMPGIECFKPIWRLSAFLLLAALVVTGVTIFVLGD